MVGTGDKLEYTNALQVVGLGPNYVDRVMESGAAPTGDEPRLGPNYVDRVISRPSASTVNPGVVWGLTMWTG
jgi:hypothetical protein